MLLIPIRMNLSVCLLLNWSIYHFQGILTLTYTLIKKPALKNLKCDNYNTFFQLVTGIK